MLSTPQGGAESKGERERVRLEWGGREGLQEEKLKIFSPPHQRKWLVDLPLPPPCAFYLMEIKVQVANGGRRR